jgi:hypothetical protein
MSDIARYSNPVLQPAPDVNAAMHAFISTYALPALPPEAIFAGYQNHVALPGGSNEFAVYNAGSRVRYGTNVEEFIAGAEPSGTGEGAGVPDHTLITTLYRIPVRIDLYSDTDWAFHRASALEVISRSPAGVQFFQERGRSPSGSLSLLYADTPQDTTVVLDAEQFVSRWSITVHLSCCVRVAVALQGFDVVSMSRLENVDVHHRPAVAIRNARQLANDCCKP